MCAGLAGAMCGAMEYADNVFLLASSLSPLQQLVTAMNNYCEDLHMQVSVAKTKVMVLGGHTNHIFTCANWFRLFNQSNPYFRFPFPVNA